MVLEVMVGKEKFIFLLKIQNLLNIYAVLLSSSANNLIPNFLLKYSS
jgi:hypothetical protein